MKHDWPSIMPELILEPDEDERGCPSCVRRMATCDHRWRRIETKGGPLRVCCKLVKCPDPSCLSAGKTFSPVAEQFLAPPKVALDWELFAWIGHRRFARHWSVPTICAELADTYQVVFSKDAVEQYVHRYERMVAARHEDPAQLEDAYANVPDLVLSIDGLQPEKGHETLYVVRELSLGRVWFAAPLLSSAATEIESLLERAGAIAKKLGKPIRSWVSDKQDAFVTGIAKLFPGVPHRLCKTHFVRILAKETHAKDSHVKVKLRKKVRGLRAIERKALEMVRTVSARVVPDAQNIPSASHPTRTSEPASSSVDEEPWVDPNRRARRARGQPPAASDNEPARDPCEANARSPEETEPWVGVVLDYCAATRGILNNDQGTPLDPPGLRMARALEDVKASLDKCQDAKKGGPLRNS